MSDHFWRLNLVTISHINVGSEETDNDVHGEDGVDDIVDSGEGQL